MAAALAILAAPAGAGAEERGVSFEDIAGPGTALDEYRRAPSPEHERREGNRQRPFVMGPELMAEPAHDRGLPGVVVFDYDGDGDLDIFVSNGPGRPNSLYRNQLRQTGELGFVDVAADAGVALTDLDANGACAGDLNNDGSVDLYVLGRNAPNRLLENRGDGSFVDMTATSGAGAERLGHASCTMADFDGDGLLDIAVANPYDMMTFFPVLLVPYGLNHPNQLLMNNGDGTFTDASRSSGFASVRPKGTAIDTPLADVSWAIAAVDYDQDGDVDLLVGNDQGPFPMAKYGGVDRGFVSIYRNDGSGSFDEVTEEVGTAEPGAWMGLSFGDFNFDGNLDLFGTNAGDYVMFNVPAMWPAQQRLGDYSSRWLLQRGDGSFVDPRRSSLERPAEQGLDPDLGGLNATPFGWGTSAADYDNDGHTDILFHGGLHMVDFVTADNPGALLRNRGPGALRDGFFPAFAYDDAFERSGVDHRRHVVTGVAAGDLNENGFVDVVSVAQSRLVGDLTPFSEGNEFDFGSPFDAEAGFLRVYERFPMGDSDMLRPTGRTTEEGDLAVEINSGNANRSATVETLGSVGITRGGSVNRDGVGAVVHFTPIGGTTAIRPVIAGSSFLSQDALEGVFGMGRARSGTVEVRWPGGVHNKLFEVRAGERITFPEIPCGFDDDSLSDEQYTACVEGALDDLVAAGELTRAQADRFRRSALMARSSGVTQ